MPIQDLVHSLQPATLINSRLGKGGLHDYQSMGDKLSVRRPEKASDELDSVLCVEVQ